MYVLGASAAIPFLELASYAGYPFVPACIAMVARMILGARTFHLLVAAKLQHSVFVANAC